jgi:hypothetical protein
VLFPVARMHRRPLTKVKLGRVELVHGSRFVRAQIMDAHFFGTLISDRR